MSKRTLILLGTSFLLFLVAAIIRFTTFNQMRQYTREVEASRDLIVSLEKLSNHLKSAQIYAGDSSKGKVYNFYKLSKVEGTTILQILERIGKSISKEKPQQQVQWEMLERSVKEHLPVLLDKNINQIAQSEDRWRLGALLRINSSIHYMVSHEEQELDAKETRLNNALAWTDAVSFALILIALGIIGVTFSHNLRLARKERWLQGFLGSVLNSSQAGIISYKAVREKGKITGFTPAYNNEAVKPLLNIGAEEDIMARLERFIREALLHQKFVIVVEEGTNMELEINYTARGNDRWLQVFLAKRDDGLTLSLHDISTIKRYQEDLKHSIQQLERSNAELEQYAYAASHDLQEPLRKITTFGHLLNDTQAEKMDEKGKRHLEKILSSASRMSILIRDLLSFSSLKRQTDFEPVNLREVVDNVLQDLELAIAQKNARIYQDPLPVIEAIPLQMHQLFFNLLNNALKFSSPNRRPEIRITCSPLPDPERAAMGLKEDRPYLQLIVSDNGIGFDEGHAQHIFGLFKRLNNKELYSGSGIGLALCKRVVENHLGHIHAEGREGQGARFYMVLPVCHPEAQSGRNSLAQSA